MSEISKEYNEEKIVKLDDESKKILFNIAQPSYFQTGIPKILHFFQPKSKFLHLINLEKNPKKDIIIEKIELEISFQIPRWHRSLITPSGNIYLFGGADIKNGTKKLNCAYIYDPNGFLMRGLPNMRNARSNHSVIYHKEFIYVIGGESSEGKNLVECERISLKTKIWEQLPKLKTPIKDAMTCLFKDRYIYVIGGKSDDTTISQSIQRLDTEFLEWNTIEFYISELLKKLNFSLLSLGVCCQINEDCIYIAGGSGAPPDEEKSSQSFLLKIDSKENTHQIMGYNQFILPVEEAFWTPQPIIDNSSIYALQNISHEVERNAVFLDRKRILKFNNAYGWVVYE